MALLNKIRSASLVETLTASLIILIVFMIASFSFNNIVINSIKSDEVLLQNRLQELEYLFIHDEISFPFYEEGPYWTIAGQLGGEVFSLHIENDRSGKVQVIEIQVN